MIDGITAIAFDLDGTLLSPDKTITPRTAGAVAACREKGIRIILSTGRSVDSTDFYRKSLDLCGPQVCYNGAEVVDMPAGKVIHAEFLDPGPALFCARLAKEMDVYYQAYFPAGVLGEGEVLMADKVREEARFYAQSTGVRVAEGDLEAALSRPGLPGVIKAMFVSDEKVHRALYPRIREQFGDSVYIVQSTPEFLEVLAKGASKGAGLARALEYLNLKSENTLAFGDEENDLPMFALAAYSAAPANAKPRIQEAARFRIPSNSEEGVAAFLEEQVLGFKPASAF